MADDATPGAATGGEAGIPQIDFATFPNQIFWLVVTLVAIYFILSRVALPRISAVLAERQGTLTNDLAAAEDLKRQAAEAEDAYNQALADARAEAQKIAEATRTEIQADLADAMAKADAEISAKSAESEARIAEIRAGALQSVEEVARDVAADVVAAVAPGQSVDAQALAQAVADRVKG
jgi:F-type H+-transporting ATPase subunit b